MNDKIDEVVPSQKHDVQDGLWLDMPNSPKDYLETGILLPGFQMAVRILWFASLIEYWKIICMLCWPPGPKRRFARSLAIDCFVILQWITLSMFLFLDVGAGWARLLVSYFIVSVLFSHFYYHVWRTPPRETTHDSQLRRTVSFILSFCFGFIAFAYLYKVGHVQSIAWPQPNGASVTNAILLSVSVGSTASFADFQPLSSAARWLMASEVFFVLAFIVIIIINSMPKHD